MAYGYRFTTGCTAVLTSTMVNIADNAYQRSFIVTHKGQAICTLKVVSNKVSHCNLLTKIAGWSFCQLLVSAEASYDISVKKMLYFFHLRFKH